MQSSTLRPGMLVSLKTSVRGNCRYFKTDIETDRIVDGAAKAKWQTERTISDPAEYEAAKKLRTNASGLVRKLCTFSSFGLLCAEDKSEQLDEAIKEARAMTEAFNDQSELTKVSLYVLTGRVASDDVEAVKAINSEVRDLIEEMADGVQRQDVKTIREAAQRAKQLGDMLSVEAAAKVQMAIDAARGVAKKLVKAEGEPVGVDQSAMNRIRGASELFMEVEPAPSARAAAKAQTELDLDDGEIETLRERLIQIGAE